MRALHRLTLVAVVVPAIAAGAALATKKSAHAEDATADKAELAERCAVRISMALVGASPDAKLLGAADPQAEIDGLVETPEFAERFSRFINSEVSGMPSESPANDPVYFLAHHVITENKPWTDLFIGPYDLIPTATGMTIADDPNGIGYFGTKVWRKKFAGSEEQGMMLVAAFRTIQNTTGLELKASVGKAGEDRTATGRAADACKGCHFEPWFALDKAAALLPKRVGTGDAVSFVDRDPTTVPLLGKTIGSYKELVHSLVESDAWRFNQCRRVFKFLYGRAENACEAKVFDACVDVLNDKKNIKDAVASVAKDPSFCSN